MFFFETQCPSRAVAQGFTLSVTGASLHSPVGTSHQRLSSFAGLGAEAYVRVAQNKRFLLLDGLKESHRSNLHLFYCVFFLANQQTTGQSCIVAFESETHLLV